MSTVSPPPKRGRGRPKKARLTLQWWTVQQTACWLRVAPDRVRDAITAPGLPFFQGAKFDSETQDWLIPTTALSDWLQPDLQPLLKIADAAKLWRLPRLRIVRAINAGDIKAVTVLGQIRLSRDTILDAQIPITTRRKQP